MRFGNCLRLLESISRTKRLYLVDTTTVGYIVDGRAPAARAMMATVIQRSPIAISTITEAEILFDLARKPEATRLRSAVEALLSTLLILPWDSAAASAYGTLRARMYDAGKSLSTLDMLIAAHAVATNSILVTRDAAFSHVQALHSVVNWATDI